MKYHRVEQGHLNWFKLRMGRVTASEAKNLLTPQFASREGEMMRTYMYSKLAEEWRGKPLIHTGSWATEQGEVRQEEAIPWLALEKEWRIAEGGFLETDDGLAGCSPDGIVGNPNLFPRDAFGIEVKCAEPTSHVRWLIEGVVPKDYIVQVHFSLYVSGFQKWVFLAYHRDYPKLVLEVQRDEKIIGNIREAVNIFYDNMAIAREKMNQWDAREFNQ